MARASLAELNRLRGSLPELLEKQEQLRTRAASELGIEFVVPPYGGLRTENDQAKLARWRDEAVARGEPSYPVAPFGLSFHERGSAFDVEIVKHREASLDAAYAKLGQLGKEIGLRWGGDFRRVDVFHYELPTTLAKAKAIFVEFLQRGSVQLGALALAAALGGWLASGRLRG